MQPMQNLFIRSMLHNQQGGGGPPQTAYQNAPQAQQQPQGGQDGLSWQQALGFGLMSLGEGMGGPRSLAPLIIRSMLQRQLQERDLQAEQGLANSEQKQGMAQQAQARQALLRAGVPENQVDAMLLNPETAGTAISGQMDPFSLAPGATRYNPLDPENPVYGAPRTVATAPGGAVHILPTDPNAANTMQSSGPTPGTVEDGYRFRGGDPSNPDNWEPVNGGPASAPGGFR